MSRMFDHAIYISVTLDTFHLLSGWLKVIDDF